MSGTAALVLALALLGLSLAVAVLRPPAVPEVAVAGLGALLLLAVGAIGLGAAGHALGRLAPTVGFLAALLVLAEGCRREGLFAALGQIISSRAAGSPRRLLALVFAAATVTTIVLGLDATVVLLTPVVIAGVRRLRVDPRAPLYACAHLANSASLLLPVSNLTNLLAFRASGLSFVRFAGLMALPTIAVVAVEWVVLARWAPAREQDPSPRPLAPAPSGQLPRYGLVVVGLTLAGFALSSVAGIDPVWVAVAGAGAISLPALVARRAGAVSLVRSVQPGFLGFVLALGVIVACAGEHGLTSAVRAVLPGGSSLGDLLVVCGVAAVLANLVNNLPATLILIPVAAALGTGPVLAVLVGVNVGPNLTEVGSLATLLWRRVLAGEGIRLGVGEFARLGGLTVPCGLALATTALWVSAQLV